MFVIGLVPMVELNGAFLFRIPCVCVCVKDILVQQNYMLLFLHISTNKQIVYYKNTCVWTDAIIIGSHPGGGEVSEC